MQTFACRCGNSLFFENTHCIACESEVGWCPSCSRIMSLEPIPEGGYRCDCGSVLNKCHNYAVENVCNRLVLMEEGVSDPLCDCCRYNEVIPDLTIEGHRERWAALEAAKRRLFHTLDLLNLPYGTAEDGIRVPLSFSFMADALPDQGLWRTTAGKEKVYTGHANGHITINVKEADDVERERLRIDMNESHRTLIGHFRHEVGHYYWDLLVKGLDEDNCRQVFGDHDNPTYADALELYYQQGAPTDWPANFISAYATMHSWEDFAETFAFYLDMSAVLDTAQNMGFAPAQHDGSIDGMLRAFHHVGLSVNELNRDMGLLDLAPAAIPPPVRDKLAYLHSLIANANASLQAAATTQ